MKLKKAYKISRSLLLASLAFVLVSYWLNGETGWLSWLLFGIGVALCAAGIVIQCIYLRCPHCGKALLWRGELPDYCSGCGGKIEKD